MFSNSAQDEQSQGQILVYILVYMASEMVSFMVYAWETVLFSGKIPMLGVHKMWALEMILSSINSVVLDKSVILSEPQFPHL